MNTWCGEIDTISKQWFGVDAIDTARIVRVLTPISISAKSTIGCIFAFLPNFSYHFRYYKPKQLTFAEEIRWVVVGGLLFIRRPFQIENPI